MSDVKETYYQILRIPETASNTEVIAAYHAAKQAYSTSNVASYSILNEADSESFLSTLDEAYQVLSDPKRRNKYDKQLKNPSRGVEKMETSLPVGSVSENVKIAANNDENKTQDGVPTLGINGARLKNIRESRKMSLEDVSRITKIPLKFIKALEDESAADMPARVYMQGFVKNLANAYKLDPNETAKAYLQSIDSKTKTNPL